jgi:hypothetical protein
MGRPPLGDRARKSLVTIKLTRAEYERVQESVAAANATGSRHYTMADWIRERLGLELVEGSTS